MLAAVTVPTLLMLGVFAVLVTWWVRADRLADFDTSLASRAGGLGAMVERDWGEWEMDVPEEGVLDALTGVRIASVLGEPVYAYGELEGRTWSGEFDVDNEGPAIGPPRVRVTVSASTGDIDDEVRQLQSVMAALALGLAGASVALGLALSRRIVGAEELARLQARFDQQTRFTADASHELRTPLALVRTEVDIALRRERDGAYYREALLGVRLAADRMQGILESLLLLARSDAGEEVERVGLDLADVARDAAAPLSVDAVPAPMLGDPRLLGILIRNLVSNALRHTPSGAVRVRVGVEGRNVVLRVRDEGEGIAPEALPHVLERFYRVDTARSRDQGGSGLGLSIVDAVARLHGGTVEIESTLGRGTAVTVRFPWANPLAG